MTKLSSIPNHPLGICLIEGHKPKDLSNEFIHICDKCGLHITVYLCERCGLVYWEESK